MVIKTAEEFLQYLEKVTGHKQIEYNTKMFDIDKRLCNINWRELDCNKEDIESLYEYIKEHEE